MAAAGPGPTGAGGVRNTVDGASATPPFEQLRAGIAVRIHDGSLPGGARLPSVRALAEDLGLAANTVARAYRELEAAGLVQTRGRNGTVVAWSADDGERALQQAAATYAHEARRLGADPAAALRSVEQALGAASA